MVPEDDPRVLAYAQRIRDEHERSCAHCRQRPKLEVYGQFCSPECRQKHREMLEAERQ